jgi:hypothetical protein
VQASLTKRVTAEYGWGYGYQWRLGQAVIGDQLVDLFFASGRGGQHIFVVPELRLVAVFTAQPIDNPGGHNRNFIMMEDYVLPAVTGLATPKSLSMKSGQLSRYAGRYRHPETGEEATVTIGVAGISVWPAFWWRIPASPIGPNRFIGYSGRTGRLYFKFLSDEAKQPERFEARFLFGKRVYERIQPP